ncbi:MAG: PAS domain-containing protein [Candidatus Thorarchaeota archaeon]
MVNKKLTVPMDFLTKLIDEMNVGIVLINHENKIIHFNKIAGEMLQQNPEDRLGTSILRCHGAISEENVLRMINDLRNGVMEKYEGWVNFRGRMLYEHIYPIRNSEGEYLGIVEELHDAKEKAEYLKNKGEWKDIHISGLGEKSPRDPHP